jgi:hypothetical protein
METLQVAIDRQSSPEQIIEATRAFLSHGNELRDDQQVSREGLFPLDSNSCEPTRPPLQAEINNILVAIGGARIDGRQINGDYICDISTVPEQTFQQQFEQFIDVLDNELTKQYGPIKAGFVLKIRAMLEKIRIQESKPIETNRVGKKRSIDKARETTRKYCEWTSEQVSQLSYLCSCCSSRTENSMLKIQALKDNYNAGVPYKYVFEHFLHCFFLIDQPLNCTCGQRLFIRKVSIF